MKTKYGLIASTVLWLIPFVCYGDVITKVGETCLMTPSFSYVDINLWSPQGNKILLISNKDSKYYNVNVMNSDGTSFQRLTDDDATAIVASWSKDGNKIYYESYYQGLDTLWSMNPSGGSKTLLVQAPEHYSLYQFAVSPDNTKIAYQFSNINTETANLYIMDTDGGNQTELTKAAPNYFGGFCWSNDSTEIMYYYSDGSNLTDPAFHIVNTGNTVDTEFITLSESQAPKWQPQGNKILYLDYTTDNQIFSINSDGTGNTQLTTDQGYVDDCLWSPDGTKILFQTYTDNEQTEAWTMNADGTNKNKIVTFDYYGQACWSADSTKVVYSDFQNIWVTDANGTNPVKITDNTMSVWSFSPSFNGTYNKLAFCHTYPDRKAVNIINVDGSSQKEIASSSEEIDTVVWNPKTEQILYTFYPGGILDDLWSINSDGTNQVQLATHCEAPSFSPDGTKIAYLSSGVYIMNSDGTNKTKLTSTPTYAYSSVSWSPQGDSIATEQYSDQTHGSDICSIKIDNTEQNNLTNGTDRTLHTYPSWSLDGSKIAYFVRNAPATADNGLWVMDSNGSNQRQLYQFYPPWNQSKWDSAGRIYFIKENPMSQVFSIKTDGTDLRTESGDEAFIDDFALSPVDSKIAYASNSNIFIKSAEEQIIPSDSVDSNTLTVGNNVLNQAKGQKAYIFVPTKLHDITIKIFTITGALVKKFESVSTPTISWDGKNEDGQIVASGVYLVILESLEKTQKDKIIILK